MLWIFIWNLLNRSYVKAIYEKRIQRCLIVLASGLPVLCEIGKVNALDGTVQLRAYGANKHMKVNGSSWTWLPIYQTAESTREVFIKIMAKYCGVKRKIFEKPDVFFARVQKLASDKMCNAIDKEKSA